MEYQMKNENDRVTDISALPLILTVEDLTRIFAVGKNATTDGSTMISQ